MSSAANVDGFFLRDARASDIHALNAIALKAKASWGYSSVALQRWHDELTLTESDLLRSDVIVAEQHGESVGYVRIDPAPATLEGLWVHPDAMGRGIGRRLFERAVVIARSHGATCLAIDSDPNAAGFYLRVGATCAGSVRAPVDDDPSRVRPQFVLTLSRGLRAGR